DVDVRGERSFLHHEVHDTGDSVRAVLSRRSVPEDFHTVDGALGDRVQVHAARAGAHPVREVVHEGGLMPPPTVQQHQGLVRAQAPQGARAVDVPSVGDALVRDVYSGGELLQDLARLRRPRPLDVLGRPFTLRGLSPDQTLVLLNGWRRHQTALVNNFTYGMGAGSSGVDLNTITQSAIDRMEVLRDGASAQYGSDAIAGVVNLVMKEGPFTPYVNVDAGRYVTDQYPDDGTTTDLNGGWGVKLGRGSLAVFGEFLDREPTNRAWADPGDNSVTDLADSVNSQGQVVIKRNPVPQPSSHWGDGLEKDAMTLGNLRLPLNDARTSELYAFGGYSFRKGTGNAYRRYGNNERNWPEIYPVGFLPEFAPHVTDYSAAGGWRGTAGGWSLDLGASFGHNHFDYDLANTLNTSLGPCLDPAAPCAPGPDGILGNADDPRIPNQTSFYAGRLLREELITQANVTKALNLGLRAPVSVALGAAFRRERYKIEAGELASYIDGGDTTQAGTKAVAGSQGFPGFAPADVSDNHRTNFAAYLDVETEVSARVLADVAGRFEHYSDFGSRMTGKLALRYQPTKQFTLRGAASTGF